MQTVVLKERIIMKTDENLKLSQGPEALSNKMLFNGELPAPIASFL